MAQIERKGQQLGSVRAEPVEQTDEDVDLTKLRKDELVELAGGQGVDTDGLTKAEIIEALQSEGES
jgi:hypothetical protein